MNLFKRSLFAVSVLFVLVGMTATASAQSIEKTTIRIHLQDSISESQYEAFVTDTYNSFDSAGLDGVFLANGGWTWLTDTGWNWAEIEGSATDVDNEISDLENDSRVDDVTVLNTDNPDSSTLSDLILHGERDIRERAVIESSASQYKTVMVRAEFDSSLSSNDKLDFLDETFEDYANAELGGVMITSGDWNWIEIDGEASVVDSKVDALENASELTNVQTLDSVISSSQTYESLTSHSFEDVGRSN
jgi:hypothetical protein